MFVCLFQGGFCLTDMSEFAEILKVVTPLYDLPCGGHTLTGAIFETGAYGVPSKSQKSFICGGVRQTITLKSPSKGHSPQPPPEGYSDYPYLGCSTKNQVLRPALIFLFFLKKSIYYNLVSVATCPSINKYHQLAK